MRRPTTTTAESLQIDLVTFGGGGSRFRRAAHRLKREAAASRSFGRIYAYTDALLRRRHPEFGSRHRAVLTRSTRGFGYWIWKPYLILDTLQHSSASHVMYLDAGCVLNTSTDQSRARLRDYVAMADGFGAFLTMTTVPEYEYCKVDTMNLFGLIENDRASPQLQAGVVLLRNSQRSRELVGRWLEVCLDQNYHFVDDSPSAIPEHIEFVEHRHDQAVLSCLAKASNLPAIPDETFFAPSWVEQGRDYPIWAPRHKWGSAFTPGRSSSAALRLEVWWDRIERGVGRT